MTERLYNHAKKLQQKRGVTPKRLARRRSLGASSTDSRAAAPSRFEDEPERPLTLKEQEELETECTFKPKINKTREATPVRVVGRAASLCTRCCGHCTSAHAHSVTSPAVHSGAVSVSESNSIAGTEVGANRHGRVHLHAAREPCEAGDGPRADVRGVCAAARCAVLVCRPDSRRRLRHAAGMCKPRSLIA